MLSIKNKRMSVFLKKLTSIFLSFVFFYTQSVLSQEVPNYSTASLSEKVIENDSYNSQTSQSPQNTPNYSGSHATDTIINLKENINEKTGDVNLSYNLVNVSIPGLNADFSLNLNYGTSASQFPGAGGLPSGWSYDLPFLDLTSSNKAIVHFNGVSYTEDSLWTDSENYQSGLRYANSHGIKFQRFLNQQQLQLDPQTTIFYNMTLKFVDGSKVYFDSYGRPIVKKSKFNLYFVYTYYDQGSFLNSRIKEIYNSLYKNQKLVFYYDSNSISLVSSNKYKTTIYTADNKLVRIENAVGEQTLFQYNTGNQANFVTNISYPSGLNTVFKYDKFLTIGKCGTQSIKPVVSEVIHTDASQNNKILNDTYYSFSTTSNANYSGYPNISSCPKSEQDLLMESNNFSFMYDVLVTRVGNVSKISDNGKSVNIEMLVTSTKTTYNFLHFPIIVETYSSKLPSNTPYFTTYYKYNLTQDIHKMGPAYNYPVAKETFVYDPNAGGKKPYLYSEFTNDAFGNQTSVINFKYSDVEKKWVPISKKLTEYFTDSENDYSLPKKEDTFDYITNTIYENNYTRTQDKKNIGTKIIGILNSESVFIPSLAYTHVYDEFGRTLSEVTECLDNSENMCQGNIKRFVKNISYNYNESQNILQTQTTDAASHVWTTTYDVGIGKELSKVSPSGIVTSLSTYDDLGRIKSEQTPGLNNSDVNKKTFAYKSLQNNGVNEVTETSRNNYSLTIVNDALGREIQKYDNFYPDMESTGKSIVSENKRVLDSKEFNSYGLLDSETNQFGQKTLKSYDDTGRVNGTVDSLKNIKFIQFDDVNRTENTYLNGAKISAVVKDNQDNIIQTTIFPNENYKCTSFLGDYCSNISADLYTKNVQKSEFDAFKREIKKEDLFYNSAGVLIGHSSVNMNYNILGKVYLTTFNGYDGVSAVRTQSYDIFGNVVSFTKQRSENGNVLPLFVSDKYQYNNLSQLEKIVRQDGKEELYTYNDDGFLIQKKSYSGVVHSFSYYYNNLLKSEQISAQSHIVALNNIVNFALSVKEKLNLYFNVFFSSKSESKIATNNLNSLWKINFDNTQNFNEINYIYNNQNSLLSIFYSTNGVADPVRKVTYEYLADGLTNTAIIYANGNTQATNYDRFGREIYVRDISNNVSTYTYDYSNNHPERMNRIESSKNKQLVVYEYYKDTEINENGMFGTLKGTLNFLNDKLISSNYVVSDPLFRELVTIKLNNIGNIIQKKLSVFDDYNHLSQLNYTSDIDASETANYYLNYTYDSTNILVGTQKLNSTHNKLYEEAYSVDSNYNVLERSIFIFGELTNTIKYSYNNLNQLISYTSSQSTKPFELSYDADGRMIVDDLGNNYSYENFSDKITEIRNFSNNIVAQYTYYPTTQRMAKMVNSSNDNEPTEFYYNSEGHVSTEAQKNSTGEYSFASYLFENKEVKSSRILSTNKEGDVSQSFFYVNNSKNTDKTFTQNNSFIGSLQTYFYSPYGEMINSQGQSVTTLSYPLADNPYGYENSRVTDAESGLILLNARFYNPRLMRFMSLDSYNVDNKYSYANGDPIGNADPSGHMPKAVSVVLNALGILLSVVTIVASVLALQPEFAAASSSTIPAMLGAIGGGFGVASGALSIASLYTQNTTSLALNIASVGSAFLSIIFNIGSSVAWFKLSQQPNYTSMTEAFFDNALRRGGIHSSFAGRDPTKIYNNKFGERIFTYVTQANFQNNVAIHEYRNTASIGDFLWNGPADVPRSIIIPSTNNDRFFDLASKMAFRWTVLFGTSILSEAATSVSQAGKFEMDSF